MLACDLDYFKAVDDRHGDTSGDAVLRDVATCCAKCPLVRVIYRIGGEEFLFFLPGATSRDAADLRSGRAKRRGDPLRRRPCRSA